MYKGLHRHSHTRCDTLGTGLEVPLVTYKVTAWRRWCDFFMFRFGFGMTCVNIGGDCRYSTESLEPYQPDRGIITVDGVDLFELLEHQKVRGRVLAVATMWSNNAFSRTDMKNAECRLFVGFTRKKSAMMCKLALGGS